jgi:import receptor subunit TOM20
MTSSSRSTTGALTLAGLAVAGGLLAYAAYFDYKRRNDVEFRKKLRKDKKRVDKALADSKESAGITSSKEITPEKLREALEQVKNEESPKTSEEKEAYFMQHVGLGEQLAQQGTDFLLPAALSFFRALRVYPAPVELIMIYQKTVPEPVFKIIMELTNLNVKAQVEGYYNFFPPKWTKVSIESKSIPETQTTRNVLVLAEDVKAGDVIYKEYPVVTTLDADLEAAGKYCSHCLRKLDPSTALKPLETVNPLLSSFCSQECYDASKNQFHNLLFTLDPPLPPEIPTGPVSLGGLETRKYAQRAFINYIQADGRAAPLLVAKLIARQVAIETNKMVQTAKAAARGVSSQLTTTAEPEKSEKDFTDAESGDYLLADHIERLRYLETAPEPAAMKLLGKVLESALPGLENFVTEERHATLLGKMAYNAYGVYFDGGRDDKPEPKQRPEEAEKSRTPTGTQRQVGSAMYTVSSYLSHSCAPNARIAYPEGTARLHLIAERDIKKGDELTVAFVDVTQREGESVIACRRGRRIELARGWRFACSCSRCELEAEETASSTAAASGVDASSTAAAPASEDAGKKEEGDEFMGLSLKDESKVEAAASRFEAAQMQEKKDID